MTSEGRLIITTNLKETIVMFGELPPQRMTRLFTHMRLGTES